MNKLTVAAVSFAVCLLAASAAECQVRGPAATPSLTADQVKKQIGENTAGCGVDTSKCPGAAAGSPGEDCQVAPGPARLLPKPTEQDGPSDYRRGMIYLGSRCPAEAISFFDSAEKKISSQNLDGAEYLLPLVQGPAEIAHILLLIRGGQLDEAQQKFIKLFRENLSFRPLALKILGSSLHLSTNEALWTEVEPGLRQCAFTPSIDNFWCKDLLVQHYATQQGIAEALKATQSFLNEPQLIKDQTEFLILYSEFLLRSGREVEATLILRSLRHDMLEHFDLNATERYLSLCVDIWGRRVRTAPTQHDETTLRSCSDQLKSIREVLGK